MKSSTSTLVALAQKSESLAYGNMTEHDHSKKTFSSRKLAMEIRMQRFKSGLTNVPARLLHRQQSHDERQRDCLFESLIDDILIYMGTNFISQSDLWSLSQASRRYASLFVPLIYNRVDLRLERIYIIDIKNKGIAKNGNNRERVLQAQKRLRKALTRQPHLNSRVRTLMWYLDDREMRTNFWDILKNMVNIETLWVCSPYGSPYCPDSETFDQYTRPAPATPSIFINPISSDITPSSSSSSPSSNLYAADTDEIIIPRCRHLTLQGIISLAFAKHLIQPSTLESFCIDCTPRWTVPILSYFSSSPASFHRLTKLSLIFPCGQTLPSSLEIDLLKSWNRMLCVYCASLVHITISSRVTFQGYYTGPPLVRPSFELLNTYIFRLFLGENVIHDVNDDESFPREPIIFQRLRTLTLKGRNMVDKTGDVFQKLWMAVEELIIDGSADTEDTLWHNQFAYSVLLR